jgi:hypothetical protein
MLFSLASRQFLIRTHQRMENNEPQNENETTQWPDARVSECWYVYGDSAGDACCLLATYQKEPGLLSCRPLMVIGFPWLLLQLLFVLGDS